jgi:hypothetical protein
MTPVFELCDDYITRWAALDPVAAGSRGITGAFGAATDYGPDGHAARADLMTSTLAGQLGAAAGAAYQGYREIGRYLREDYAPRAAEADGVGAERYAVAARLSLGADIDLAEAYEWGWAELQRIEDEMAAEADKISPGASVDEAAAILDESEYVEGADAYLAWLQNRHDGGDRAAGRRSFRHRGAAAHDRGGAGPRLDLRGGLLHVAE